MQNVRRDIEGIMSFLENGYEFEDYGLIYYCSNEYLPAIFSQIDVKDKSVLTVVGSGDQAFHFYNNGARKVDLFDKNILAFYYYYLRFWCIKYLNKFYPDEDLNKQFLTKLISVVDPKTEDEKAAYRFWREYLLAIDVLGDITSDLLVYSDKSSINKIDDLSTLKDRLNVYDINYRNIDISTSKDLGKYDIIYTSNIVDYIGHSRDNMIHYRDNLYSMLNDQGIVVATNVIREKINSKELSIFEEKFDASYLSRNDCERYRDNVGYCFRKK